MTLLDKLFKLNEPIVFVSPPGCGKSTIIINYAQQDGGAATILYPASVDPVTFLGLPTNENNQVILKPWKHVLELNEKAAEGKKAILFFDEINHGDAYQLAALQSVLSERRFGDVKLHPEVRIFAAMNPYHQATVQNQLPMPIRNRVIFIRWFEEGHYKPASPSPFVLSRKDWLMYMKSKEGGRAMIALAIESRGLKVVEEPTNDEGQFASPRSWEKLGKIIDEFDYNDPDCEQLALSTVGTEGVKAILWLRELKVPEPEALLEGHPIPKEPSIAYAAIEYLQAYLTKTKPQKEICKKLIALASRYSEVHPGLAAVLASRMSTYLLSASYVPTREENQVLAKLAGLERRLA